MSERDAARRRAAAPAPPPRWVGVAVAAVLVLVVLIIGGYGLHWRWTGLSASVTLWDWLSLLLLPTVVATASLWATSWPPSRTHLLIIGGAALALLVVAVPGYLAPWRWTGFAGNTAWDWVKLLLLPLLLPIAVIPR